MAISAKVSPRFSRNGRRTTPRGDQKSLHSTIQGGKAMSRVELPEVSSLPPYLRSLHDGARPKDWSTRHVARAFADNSDLLEKYLGFYYPYHSSDRLASEGTGAPPDRDPERLQDLQSRPARSGPCQCKRGGLRRRQSRQRRLHGERARGVASRGGH